MESPPPSRTQSLKTELSSDLEGIFSTSGAGSWKPKLACPGPEPASPGVGTPGYDPWDPAPLQGGNPREHLREERAQRAWGSESGRILSFGPRQLGTPEAGNMVMPRTPLSDAARPPGPTYQGSSSGPGAASRGTDLLRFVETYLAAWNTCVSVYLQANALRRGPAPGGT